MHTMQKRRQDSRKGKEKMKKVSSENAINQKSFSTTAHTAGL